MAERIGVEEWALQTEDAELAEVLAAIAKACTLIAQKIRLGDLTDLYGAYGATNVQGEQQQKLDVYANEVMIAKLKSCKRVAGLVSEEDDEPVSFANEHGHHKARFVVAFDPLDGSSNIDVDVNVGTIFGVREVEPGTDLRDAVLGPGSKQVAAGYVVYGPACILVLTMRGHDVSAFTLDNSNDFVLSRGNMRMPKQGPYYSLNSGNAADWPPGYRDYITMLRRGDLGGIRYNARYIGSLVADFHRTLLKGGVFLYPPTRKTPKGKLRLQYEGNPLAMIAESAGGAAVDGKQRILDIEQSNIHGRTPLVVGSKLEVEALVRAVAEAQWWRE